MRRAHRAVLLRGQVRQQGDELLGAVRVEPGRGLVQEDRARVRHQACAAAEIVLELPGLQPRVFRVNLHFILCTDAIMRHQRAPINCPASAACQADF